MLAITPTWTAERVELLKSRFEAGLTCREIADDIGVSRNAVIGKLARLNLSRAEGVSERFSEPKVSPKARLPRNSPGSPPSSQRQMLKALGPEPAAEEAPICSEHRCSLLELSKEKCRWPISTPGAADFSFCGNMPLEGMPYCAGHTRLAYRPASTQRFARG